MATLLDVARKANVSKMTVSRVINHPEQVTDELKKLVLQAMQTLDYRPNAAAKALAGRRTNVIKFFILDDVQTTPLYNMALLFGIAKELDKKQYALQLATRPSSQDQSAADGCIITGACAKDSAWIDRLQPPVILFGENHSGYDFVDTNNRLGTQMAAAYALSKGYQQLIFLGIDAAESFEASREAGFCSALQQHQPPQIHRMVNQSLVSQHFVEANWQQISRNTAFVCASDRLAIGVVHGLLAQGAAIPDDFGVFGFDGVCLGQVSNPPLATVKQPVLKLGELLASKLLQKIGQNGAPQGSSLLPPRLEIRGTMRA